MLRHAAKQARSENAGEITDSHIEYAIPEARAEIRRKNYDLLTEHQQILYDTLETVPEDELAPSELYDRYCDAVDDPKTDRTIRSYLKKLEQYNLAEGEGSGPSRVYRIVR